MAILLFSDRPENNNISEMSKIFQPIRGQIGHLAFSERPEKQHFREVKDFSANQKPWQPSLFSDRPEIHKFGRGH